MMNKKVSHFMAAQYLNCGDHLSIEDVPERRSMIETVQRIAAKHFESARGSHDWDHTLRVSRLCRHIGTAEDADMDVVMVAALLHDIGRCHQDATNGQVCHAEKGAQLAGPVVEVLPLTAGQKENILHCIRSHRFRGGESPRTTEAKVLFDADKLDAIGAVGVARAYLFAGELGARLHNSDLKEEEAQPYSQDDTGYREFKVKLCKVKDRMLTREGLCLAVERHEFMETFFKRFLDEFEGER